MKRSEVRAFIEAGIEQLSPVIGFGSGRISEFNSDRSREYPFVWLESLSTGVTLTDSGLPFDDWNIALHIAKKDSADSIEIQYEPMIDDCDFIGQKLINFYNNEIEGYQKSTITGISRVPFVKRNADILTGIILSFTLSAPDVTNIC